LIISPRTYFILFMVKLWNNLNKYCYIPFDSFSIKLHNETSFLNQVPRHLKICFNDKNYGFLYHIDPNVHFHFMKWKNDITCQKHESIIKFACIHMWHTWSHNKPWSYQTCHFDLGIHDYVKMTMTWRDY
jgi:hypothetical protein